MLIQEITLQGILSFGPETPPLEMRPLNVLIGANGSGKSNLIEAIGLLRSAPKDLTEPVRRGGGVGEWIWKGKAKGGASIGALINFPMNRYPLWHFLSFSGWWGYFALAIEGIKIQQPMSETQELLAPYYRFVEGVGEIVTNHSETIVFERGQLNVNQSVLSQIRDPNKYPELDFLTNAYGDIRIYRDWSFGRSSVLRTPQPADIPADRLAEDFSNLGMFLNRLRRTPAVKKEIIGHLRNLYAGLDDFDVSVVGGTVEVVLTEGDFTIPARRLSDGTLRYLCLLAILCDPEPPRLICIEEPELGLHPDLLPSLAKLLIEASERTQLIVTTHSDILVDAMSETPESVVVFEKHDGKTEMTRLQTGEVTPWLEKYRLGELWIRGEIGGTRW